ncbi:MAG: hypothetical protein PHT40_01660 [Patescibacteria group bacterium]|nr:hypothetical protein [Patescibacteria group bacterium]
MSQRADYAQQRADYAQMRAKLNALDTTDPVSCTMNMLGIIKRTLEEKGPIMGLHDMFDFTLQEAELIIKEADESKVGHDKMKKIRLELQEYRKILNELDRERAVLEAIFN